MKERKIGRQLFIGLLGIQGLGEFGIGLMLLFNFPETLKSGFGITYSNQLDILGVALGLYLLLLTTLMVLSIVWTIKGKLPGITIGMIVGVFLFSFGIVAFIKTGDIQALYVDSIRGVLTIIFGYMAYQELKNKKQSI
jgi:hypothetical protein